jgi:hypothetical protein
MRRDRGGVTGDARRRPPRTVRSGAPRAAQHGGRPRPSRPRWRRPRSRACRGARPRRRARAVRRPCLDRSRPGRGDAQAGRISRRRLRGACGLRRRGAWRAAYWRAAPIAIVPAAPSLRDAGAPPPAPAIIRCPAPGVSDASPASWRSSSTSAGLTTPACMRTWRAALRPSSRPSSPRSSRQSHPQSWMYRPDHPPPHFHAQYHEEPRRSSSATGACSAGPCLRALRLVRQWHGYTRELVEQLKARTSARIAGCHRAAPPA